MKREFKKGDRVLVRDGDLREWVPAVFQEIDSKYYFIVIKDNGHQGVFYQCRHIDDFSTGDKVQVRDKKTEYWIDGRYLGYIEAEESHQDTPFRHVVTTELYHVSQYRYCRWHPSVPWAEKEELTLEQRVEALERKLKEK